MSQQENFVSHLVELRDRLLRAVVGFLIVFVALMAYPGAAYIFDLLALPIQSALPEGTKMIATGVITPFMVPVKLTAMVAFVISLPVLLYQAWAFIAPGLYQHEKKMALPIIFPVRCCFSWASLFVISLYLARCLPSSTISHHKALRRHLILKPT